LQRNRFRFESDARHLPPTRPRLHHRLLEDVRATVQPPNPGRPQRTDRHGGTGHVERRHVPPVRPRHEPGVPVRQRRLRHPLLRNHGRTAIRPLHKHVSNARPPEGHRHDAETRLRRHLLRDLQVLQAKQLGPLPGEFHRYSHNATITSRNCPGHHDDGAEEVGALPGGPLSRHVRRQRRPLGGGVDRREGRRTHPDLAQGRVQTAGVESDHHSHQEEYVGQGSGENGEDSKSDADFGKKENVPVRSPLCVGNQVIMQVYIW
jgi:hypothetical protein